MDGGVCTGSSFHTASLSAAAQTGFDAVVSEAGSACLEARLEMGPPGARLARFALGLPIEKNSSSSSGEIVSLAAERADGTATATGTG